MVVAEFIDSIYFPGVSRFAMVLRAKSKISVLYHNILGTSPDSLAVCSYL